MDGVAGGGSSSGSGSAGSKGVAARAAGAPLVAGAEAPGEDDDESMTAAPRDMA